MGTYGYDIMGYSDMGKVGSLFAMLHAKETGVRQISYPVRLRNTSERLLQSSHPLSQGL